MVGAPVCSAVFLLTVLTTCYGNPEVTISHGTVRGVNLTTYNDRKFSAFLGIPYAQPPVGDLRFKNPVAANSWNDIYEATQDASQCPQIIGDNVVGDEDCLYLNVYTPRLPGNGNTGLLPVMVFIHGGGFQAGNSSSKLYGPEYLLDHDVVLVTMNYRLGLLGFLSTGDSEAPGNFGLKDQVIALKWTREYIEYFGGDPDRVTIFGESAGGALVNLLAMSDLTEGLFHQYIIQSGAILATWPYRENSVYRSQATTLGEHLGCPTNTSALLVSCLREMDVSTILDTNAIFYLWDTYPDTVWVPTNEPDLDGAVITDSPANLIAAGKLKDLPCMAGVVRDEGLLWSSDFYVNETKFDDFLTNFDDALPHILQYYAKVDDVAKFTAAIKSYYFNDDLTSNRSLLLSNFTDLAGDASFVYPVISLFEHLSSATSSSYLYSFEYRGTFSYTYLNSGDTADFGVSHVDELIYLFPHESTFASMGEEMSETDMRMVDIMVDLWVSFATNGVPTSSAVSTDAVWESYSLNDSYLRIGSDSNVTLTPLSSLHEARMQFWRELTAATVSGADSSAFNCLLLSLVMSTIAHFCSY